MSKVSITESQLQGLITEAIQQAIDEGYFGDRLGSFYQGYQAQRHNNKAGKLKQQIDAQIQKSEQIIKQEQAKINALRQKYNAQIDASKAATDKANAYYNSAHGTQNSQQYGYVAGPKDKRTSDFTMNRRPQPQQAQQQIQVQQQQQAQQPQAQYYEEPTFEFDE